VCCQFLVQANKQEGVTLQAPRAWGRGIESEVSVTRAYGNVSLSLGKINVAWQLFANRLNTLWGSLHAFLSYPLPISTVVTQTCGLVHGDPAMEFTERSDDMNSSISLTSYHERP
jgi:hypothetical protein